MVQMTPPAASRLICLTLLIQLKYHSVLGNSNWFVEKHTHKSKPISLKILNKLAVPQITRTNSFENLLEPILVPRIPGTPTHTNVKEYIAEFMKNLGWEVESDKFRDFTPIGEYPFENIIATLNPTVPRRLVIACHYDSKIDANGVFIGAIDSAVPCAMMLHLAKTLEPAFNAHKTSHNNVTLQFIFFDGEEAFVEWTRSDSTYGSRHLAEKWSKMPFVIDGQNPMHTTYLDRIDVMVLLDLLGARNPKFYNFFESTFHWHNLLVNTEKALRQHRLWSGQNDSPYFVASRHYGGIEDDHIPFVERGVNIIHVIPSPFPKVWHKLTDNKNALHFPTIENLNKILRTFVAGYLHLDSA